MPSSETTPSGFSRARLVVAVSLSLILIIVGMVVYLQDQPAGKGGSIHRVQRSSSSLSGVSSDALRQEAACVLQGSSSNGILSENDLMKVIEGLKIIRAEFGDYDTGSGRVSDMKLRCVADHIYVHLTDDVTSRLFSDGKQTLAALSETPFDQFNELNRLYEAVSLQAPSVAGGPFKITFANSVDIPIVMQRYRTLKNVVTYAERDNLIGTRNFIKYHGSRTVPVCKSSSGATLPVDLIVISRGSGDCFAGCIEWESMLFGWSSKTGDVFLIRRAAVSANSLPLNWECAEM
mmetsp:Transcript_33361/g.54121  ORF Transcript_33361/g.54121 Transcript_33361/m.54121 type:complete len:291 (+) Transcript_33361:85-957(+)|eukprot:CAMPEP_0184656916 /NCGR_PEP_ID=MMETSP0308-20130426/16840_1 /TAXON_ID=38269 /ORGANISM="Gloeochaete witrockiana, Strain SAG 46.84" /LENGTH=290 /DNA_ID=CAMNT_0027094241 /DNA_START=60 /DNA_END=932 /DNA_ORIENTATION=+